MPTTVSREALKHVALCIAGLIVLWCVFVLGWCAIFKIYIDVPMLLVLSNLAMGVASSITTLLVGRTLSQLNQSGDTETTMTQTTETVTKPKAPSMPPGTTEDPVHTIVANPPEQPANVTEVPKP